MTDSMKVALISAALGFLFGSAGTLFFEPIVNKKDAGQQAIFRHLESEYVTRKERFTEIRRAAQAALRTRDEGDILKALVEAENLPFFRPRIGEMMGENEPINDYTSDFSNALLRYQESGSDADLDSAQYFLEKMTCFFDLSLRAIEYQMFEVDQEAQENFVAENWNPEELGNMCTLSRF